MTYENFRFRKKDHIEAHLSNVVHSSFISDKLIGWTMKPYHEKHALIFSGNVGNGKTYFAAAYYNSLIEQKKNVRVYDEAHLLNEIRLSWEKPGESQTYRINLITDAEYLILDDFGSTGAFLDKFSSSARLGMSDNDKKILEEVLNARLEKDLPFLITTNFSEKYLTSFFSPRIISRLFAAENTVVEINISDRRKNTNF